MFPLGLLLVEAAFLTVAHVAGGPPWTVVGAIAFAVLGVAGNRQDGAWHTLVWLILPSLGWLAAFWATGDRELFFPFTMYLAAHSALTVSGRGMIPAYAAGGLVVAVFLVIRVIQAATPNVLAVEAVAAAVILGATCLVLFRRERSPIGDGLLLALASAAAFVSLRLPS